MNLKSYIEARHVQLDLSLEQAHELFGSKTRYTRIMNRPKRATLPDVLRLALRINIHPLTLIENYDMGTLMITNDDRVQLRDHYSITPTALRNETLTNFPSPAPCAQNARANPQPT